MSLPRDARRRLGDERGMTLPELLVSMALLGIAIMIFYNGLASVQTGLTREESRSISLDQARLAMYQIDREVRSGSVLYPPENENPANFAGYVLRVYTQANAPTRVPPHQCIRWRIWRSSLQRQSYHIVSRRPVVISRWRTVAENVVNRDAIPRVPAFSLNPSGGGRVVDVTLLVDVEPEDTISRTVRVKTSLTIRNAYRGDPCSPTPAWNG